MKLTPGKPKKDMAEKGKAAEITKKDMNKKTKQNTFRTCF